MAFPTQFLYDTAEDFGICLSDEQLGRFAAYAAFLVEYNEKVNLTAITDDKGIATHHFADSLLLLTALQLPEGSSLIDVGTGAGFPGVVVKMVRPDIKLTLLDSLNKRIAFLQQLSALLGQPDNVLVHGRAEDMAHGPMREAFDFATARAVAGLPALCEYCLPFVRVGGQFAALKGPGADDELRAATRAMELLGGGNPRLARRDLPGGDQRGIVLIEKRSQTPTKYPRQRVKIPKNPL